jgi:hypothetical protein
VKVLNYLIAAITGLIVLLGDFFPGTGISLARSPLLDWAVTLSGVAGLVAILNLVFHVHWKRIQDKHPRRLYSGALIVTFLLTVVAGVFLDPGSAGFQKLVTRVQVPVESTLMAVLAITLVFASLKLLQRQRNWMGFLFFLSVIIFLVLNSGVLAFSTEIPILTNLLSAFHRVPMAGARGMLLGIALGSLATGIRVLIGSEKPYNG